MVNGNDIVVFEENNIERLTDSFIKEHSGEWEAFVLEEFNNRGIGD